MKGGINVVVPPELTEWLSKENCDWVPSYPFNEAVVRRSVVSALHRGQHGLCVYCGKKLDMSAPGKTYHIEHFRPQSKYSERQVDFRNLFISCGQDSPDGGRSQTCGTHKDEWFDEGYHIFPNYPECLTPFSFRLNGLVAAVDENDRAAVTMIEVLNLNHSELIKEREQYLSLIDSGAIDLSDFWDMSSSIAESYAHIAFYKAGQVLP